MNEEQKTQIERYEQNIKLHYEAKRKELDILLSSSIPTQLSNMKTILWINFLMIGLIFQFIKKFPLPDIIVGFFFLSISAIVVVLAAMLFNRTKSYGVPDNPEYINCYDSSDDWMTFRVTKDMIYTLQGSIEENRKVIINRAKLMHIATWFTTSSLISIIFAFIAKQINL
jgi:hypothetical protein